MAWQLVAMMVITVGAAVFVAWPLLTARTRPEEFFGAEPSEPVLQRLLFQRDTTYAAMKELEFDRAMGNLSEQDFQQLYERYKLKAVALLKRIDDAKAGKLSARAAREDFEPQPRARQERRGSRAGQSSVDLDVEQEIEAFRRKSREQAAGGKTLPRSAPRTAGAASPACPSCGRAVKDPGATFCSRCGASLQRRSGPGSGPATRAKKSNGVKGD